MRVLSLGFVLVLAVVLTGCQAPSAEKRSSQVPYSTSPTALAPPLVPEPRPAPRPEAQPSTLPLAEPATQPSLESVFFPAKLAAMDAAILSAIRSNNAPGAVLWLERNQATYTKAYGNRAVVPAREPMTAETLFDLASLTKVIATTPSIMLLCERGQIELDAPVHRYIPEFNQRGKEAVTVRHLLTHTSGLRAGLSATPAWSGYDKAIQLACDELLVSPPGTAFRYSDINFVLLGEIVRRVSGRRLDEFAAAEIYRPLGMDDTGFLPSVERRGSIAPTEVLTNLVLRGEVHDPTARRMGGVAGHAGLFSTASDLARFCRMLVQRGELDGKRIFQPETVELMTSVQSPSVVPSRRGLGWDIDSGYSGPRGSHFPLGSYGHTGWTGGSIWIDPFSRTFLILLANRNHPTEAGNVQALRQRLGSLAAEAVVGFNFAFVPGALAPRLATESLATNRPISLAEASPIQAVPAPAAAARNSAPPTTPVLNGIDVLARQNFAALRGLRIGLVSNQTGTDRERRSTIDLLHTAPGVSLRVLFSPEHGIRGSLDESVSDSVDEKTGLAIHSLYGANRAPLPEQLRDLDALVFDVQDIGCRFYTYISTMGLCLEAAAKAKLKFFVLDRVNPINGETVDGPVLSGATSFTGFHPIPVRTGMTMGELARLFNQERSWNADLTVIPVQGWTRTQWFDQTGLPWINPSPNMRSLTEAALYPGVGLLETTALSVGRGTDTPFEIVGAPYINDVQLAMELNRVQLPGVRFLPVRFTPNASVFKDKLCAGVNIILTDRDHCNVVDIGIAIAQALHRFYPKDFDVEKFNRLLVHSATVEGIKAGQSLAEIRQTWSTELEQFKQRRAAYLLY